MVNRYPLLKFLSGGPKPFVYCKRSIARSFFASKINNFVPVRMLRTGASQGKNAQSTSSLLYTSQKADGLGKDEVFLVEKDPLCIDYPAHFRVLMTIPPKIDGQPLDPDGHSECILYGPAKEKIVNDPDYPAPIPKPLGTSPPYFVMPTPDMGLGLFAARDIEAGELILAERPLFVTPRSIADKVLPVNESIQVVNAFRKSAMGEFEKRIEIALGRMTPEDQEAYKSLCKSSDKEVPPLSGITINNAFTVSFVDPALKDMPSDEDSEELFDDHVGVFKIASRINHSCIPNVHPVFSTSSFSLQLIAWGDIKAGDQIFHAYCNISQPKAARHDALSKRGITQCSCPACLNATPASDKLRSEYTQRTWDFSGKILGSEDPMQPTRMLTPDETLIEIERLLSFRKELVEEGLRFTAEFGMISVLIFELYSRMGMYDEAKAYEEDFLKHKRVLG